MAEVNAPHSLETVTGKFLDLLAPMPADISIIDIAWSLSRLARYNGHTIQKIPYSVGAHSIAVSEEIGKLSDQGFYALEIQPVRLQMLGLLHDAAEAYTGDIPGPLKRIPELRPVIKGLEKSIDHAIYAAVGIDPPTEKEEKLIKYADMVIQKIEAYNFMNSRGSGWSNMPEASIEKLQEFEMPKQPLEVYHEFLAKYARLHELWEQISYIGID